jgi:chemotaxis protein methyltransferase CheR
MPTGTGAPRSTRPPEVRPDRMQDLEIRLLLQGVYERWGYDFRDYALASLRRRVRQFLLDEKLATVSAAQDRVLHDADALERLVSGLAVSVTSFFRHPGFYKTFRERALPILRTYPVVRIWHAGCSTGEEVYSMAILLEEEGLYARAQIYATDMNLTSLRAATSGSFPMSSLRDATACYVLGGGRGELGRHYRVKEGRALFDPSLRRNMVFAQHNLVTDRSFNEFNVVVCRNVMIYFNRPLQERVHALLYGSLARRGFLGLGNRESLRFTPFENRYEVVDSAERLYRKVA